MKDNRYDSRDEQNGHHTYLFWNTDTGYIWIWLLVFLAGFPLFVCFLVHSLSFFVTLVPAALCFTAAAEALLFLLFRFYPAAFFFHFQSTLFNQYAQIWFASVCTLVYASTIRATRPTREPLLPCSSRCMYSKAKNARVRHHTSSRKAPLLQLWHPCSTQTWSHADLSPPNWT